MSRLSAYAVMCPWAAGAERCVWFTLLLMGGLFLTSGSAFSQSGNTLETVRTTNERLYKGTMMGRAEANFDLITSPGAGDAMKKLGMGRKRVRFEVEYELRVLPIEENNTDGVVLFQLKWDRIFLERNAEPQAEMSFAEPDPRILGLMDHRGALQRLWFSDTYPPARRRLARKVLAATQYVAPEFPSGRWLSIETDTDGDFMFEYTTQNTRCLTPGDGRQPGPLNTYLSHLCDEGTGPIKVIKRPLKHLPGEIDWSDEMSFGRVTTPTGTQELVVHNGVLDSLAGQTDHTDRIGGQIARLAKNQLRLNLIAQRSVPLAELSALKRDAERLRQTYSGSRLHQPGLSLEIVRALHRQTLGDETLDSIRSGIRDCVRRAEQCSQGEILSLHGQTASLVYLNPELSSPVSRLLVEQPVSSVRDHIVGGALKEAGHPQAQAALALSLKALLATDERKARLVDYLCQVEQASEDTIALVRRHALVRTPSELRYVARECLGFIAGQLRKTAPETARKLVFELTSELERNEDSQHQGAFLSALGYAGTTEVLEPVIPRLSSEDEFVRAAAFWALRRIRHHAVDRVLIQAAQRDPSPDVRERIAAALGERPPTDENMGVQFQLVQEDSSSRVRQIALTSLWRARFIEPEVRILAQWVVDEVEDTGLKSLASEFLRSLKNDQD